MFNPCAHPVESNGLEAVQMWMMAFNRDSERISHVAGVDPQEVVQSSVRITSEKSYLKKYLNPNLVAISTVRGPPTAGRFLFFYVSFLNMHVRRVF